jgi:hypothetical protein
MVALAAAAMLPKVMFLQRYLRALSLWMTQHLRAAAHTGSAVASTPSSSSSSSQTGGLVPAAAAASAAALALLLAMQQTARAAAAHMSGSRRAQALMQCFLGLV